MEQFEVELNAMQTIAEALNALPAEAAERVLRWAMSSHGLEVHAPMPQRTQGHVPESPTGTEFNSFSELYDKANPENNADRALVAGYWLQRVDGNPDGFGGREVNDLLRDLGHELPNVTMAFESLQKRNPKEARQVSKAKGKMGHKTYKLTEAGSRRIEQMMASSS